MKQLIICLSIIFICTGCATKYRSYEAQTKNAPSRYSMKNDAMPTETMTVEQVSKITATDEPKSRHGNKTYTVRGKTYEVLASEKGYSQVGVASWYGAKFHNHKTSNGETYDMYKLSAAHRSLPLPSFIRVTSLANNKSVVVRVNDRGPFHSSRIIDLSYAAAVKLDFINQGTAKVKLEALDNSELTPLSYHLQVGAFKDKNKAQAFIKQLKTDIQAPMFVQSSNLHRVKIGPVNYQRANELKTQLAAQNINALMMRSEK